MEAIFATIIQVLKQKSQSRANSRLTHTKAFSLAHKLGTQARREARHIKSQHSKKLSTTPNFLEFLHEYL